ncbi:putative zinc finger C-x8-C-x5-C-x3-H type (and similar) [Lyophyllum shimeji]|uniref:Zinc finger C-x8-C-x5-C-x3-H type (And similar) n=1 Tax=Lyophyllum shimeji TaxID=47721 RepID=A0A9P3PI90_LYOSH|nr:putative zinc finger C-x8-C-x5-C-x3-H type (and similar) [Lyophyllum shimeji]
MHEAVTKSSPSTYNLRHTTDDDDLQTPTARNPQHYATDDLGWSSPHDPNTESNLENWPLTRSNHSSPAHLVTIPRSISVGLHKIPSASHMPTRTENAPSDRPSAPGNRWRFNTNGQLVDEAAGWELADEIVRLKIGEVTGETDDVHGPIRTPPKSKIAAAAVAHLSEGSPLETSSNTSVGSSPHASEHEINISHSRGSSTDTTVSSSQESIGSVPSNVLLTKPPLTVNTGNEVKERPHSFSGGLSTADLRRLQQAGDVSEAVDRQQQRPQGPYRENIGPHAEQLSYPSITHHIHRPQPQPHPQMYDYRSGQSPLNQLAPSHDDPQLDYNTPPRNFNAQAAPPAPAFVPGRPTNNIPAAGYRQPPRGFQGVIANPPAMPYPGHTSHLSLGNTQQLYDMMLPPHDHPAVARVQQQHNVFRPTHHHSASDPSAAIRDAATMALMGNNMQPFPPGLFQGPGIPPMPIYPNQYYPPQEQYPLADAAVMAARLQTQYTGQYAVLPPQGTGVSVAPPSTSPTSTNGQGPSANNRKLGLYKTELCRSWEEKGTCRYGTKCQFAHGEEELRKVARHPKYKTEICRTFWVSGTCPYGKRCCFIHTELPASGTTAAPGSGGTPAADTASQQRPDGRTRSLSTNSDPNEASVSMLARISGKRAQESNNLATPVDGSSFQFARPPTGSLRVDTTVLDTSVKQNKSAYPTFTSNGILLPAPERKSNKSPAPVTAGPDLGRHNNARFEIVGYNNQQQQRVHKANASTSSSVRHSFNGSEADINFNPSPPASSSSYALTSSDGPVRPSGHVRSGSAGNWGSFSRSSHLAHSAYPNGSSPAGDIMANSPWSSTELAVGSTRLNEKVWA